ncbi:hypothetical protein [Nocardioides sp. LHG3406-4]|uniref:hypothetical protein n=1 Tax=Nocardioides sp. LHG3406-4 TaxID=2804575 RepID=UPI003CE84740
MGILTRCAALLTVAALAGCGSQTGKEPSAPVGDADPLVATQYAVTVMDDADSGPEACLAGIATSYPPQCSGPALPGWDWAEHRGDFERSGEVRWGDFALTGTWDGDALTLTEAVPAAEYDAPDPPDDGLLGTPCPEPAGGWSVVDPATTNRQTMEAVFGEATRLAGYSQAWMDQSPNPAFDPSGEVKPEQMELLNDPRLVIVNVAVVGDLAAAEARLRTIWGGALCVTKGLVTEERRLEIQERLVDELPEFLGGLNGGGIRPLEVTVGYDDGSIQSRLDEEFGAGTVLVQPVLQPAD